MNSKNKIFNSTYSLAFQHVINVEFINVILYIIDSILSFEVLCLSYTHHIFQTSHILGAQ